MRRTGGRAAAVVERLLYDARAVAPTDPFYPPGTPLAAWAERVRASLGEGFFETDEDGLVRAPIYGPESARAVPDPGCAPFLRGFGSDAGGRTAFGYRTPTAARLVADLAEDTPLGLDVAWVVVDHEIAAGRMREAVPAPLEAGFVPTQVQVAELAAADVDAQVVLDAGAAAAAVARKLPPDAALTVRADPVVACLRAGIVPADPARIFRVTESMRAGNAPRRVVYLVDGASFADAGATPVTELACTVAAVVETVGTLRRVGADLPVPIVVRVATGTFVLDEVAKIRALRPMLAEALAPAGYGPHDVRIEARMSAAALVATDIWSNLLRGTLAALAGLCAGADAVGVEALDAACGLPGRLGRRLARNTVTLLREEAGLGRIRDPLAGGFHLERRTGELLEAAWNQLVEIAEAGGLLAYARAGTLAEKLATAVSRRTERVRRGDRPIVGVTLHPDPSLSPPADARPLGDDDARALRDPAVDELVAEVGRDLGPTETVPPMVLRRISAPFEGTDAGKEDRP
ncbi:MAG: hypothetical protein D6705_02530 [Deltaproteobacteria bacterium]|nr:MAG: hypothetical protein D6705_02530 [Deltaproteobacteria bacterium]